MADEKNRDLLLSPDTYVYMQNEGKNGMISVFIGPGVVNQTGQDKPVIYDQINKIYRPSTLENAVQHCPKAEEGDYVILENPAVTDKEGQERFPTQNVNQSVPLQKGRKVIIPGPWSNPLYPGQSAKVIPGHRLRSNQYLIVTIYNEEEAEKNWNKAVVKSVSEDAKAATVSIKKFVVGEQIVIKGTEVSFYIPPTGVEVVVDENGKYVREAVTLEQLEYSILVDENGKKRYPRGPEVVFPKPTEQFINNADGSRKFKALELNDIQGIHVKIIGAYKEGDREYKEGEEVFITGKDTAIYYPREEHFIIQYGEGTLKHYSIAVPLGEGRYVMNRQTGEIKTEIGPQMLLPDPRTEVIVRRILTPRQCEMWYPGNNEAKEYNDNLRNLTASQPSARSGFISEGDYKRSYGSQSQLASLDVGLATPQNVAATHLIQKMQRKTQYTPPRHLTLDTKYDGVPAIRVFTGYALLKISKSGKREVVVGPANLLLDYDETLEELTLSTGKPKNTDSLLSTTYLRVLNNKISDIIGVETSDHVKATIKLSLCVNFEGDKNKWFNIENYVKFLTDHIRSLLKGAAKKLPCEELYRNYLQIVRDTILGQKTAGEKRLGLFFEENGMKVTEVDVLDFSLNDPEIARLLDNSQMEVVKQDISLSHARRKLQAVKEQQQISIEEADAIQEAEIHKLKNTVAKVTEQLQLEIVKIDAEIAKLKQKQLEQTEAEALKDISAAKELERTKSRASVDLDIDTKKQQLKLREHEAATEAAVKRLTAAKENLAESIVALSREQTLATVAKAFSIDSFLSGESLESALGRIVTEIPMFQKVFDRMKAVDVGNGNNPRVSVK